MCYENFEISLLSLVHSIMISKLVHDIQIICFLTNMSQKYSIQIHPIFKKTISMQPLGNQSFDSIRFLGCYMQPISSRKYNCMLILHQISEGAHYVERKELKPCLDHVNIFSTFIKNNLCIN